MPITQDRMMKLLTTTENVLRLYERGTEFIVEVAATQASPGGPIFEANAEFSQLPAEFLQNEHFRAGVAALMRSRQALLDLVKEQLPVPVEDMRVFIQEQVHFKLNAKRNAKNRAAVVSHRERKRETRAPELTPAQRERYEATLVERDGIKASQAWWDSYDREQAAVPAPTAELDPELTAAISIDSREAYEAERAKRREAEGEDDELA